MKVVAGNGKVPGASKFCPNLVQDLEMTAVKVK